MRRCKNMNITWPIPICWSPSFLNQKEAWKWASEASLFYCWERKTQGDEAVRATEQLTGTLAREQGDLTLGLVLEQSREGKMITTGVYYIFQKHFTECGVLFCFVFSFGWKNLLWSGIEIHWLVIISVSQWKKIQEKAAAHSSALQVTRSTNIYGVPWPWDLVANKKVPAVTSLYPGWWWGGA